MERWVRLNFGRLPRSGMCADISMHNYGAATNLAPHFDVLLTCSSLFTLHRLENVWSSSLCRSLKIPIVYEPPSGSVERQLTLHAPNLTLVRLGPKTVFFWAPLMKWCLVAAGLKDLSRPAEKLSVSQNVGAYWQKSLVKHEFADRSVIALAATGFIWVRYSLVITPVNYSLAAVRPTLEWRI